MDWNEIRKCFAGILTSDLDFFCTLANLLGMLFKFKMCWRPCNFGLLAPPGYGYIHKPYWFWEHGWLPTEPSLLSSTVTSDILPSFWTSGTWGEKRKVGSGGVKIAMVMWVLEADQCNKWIQGDSWLIFLVLQQCEGVACARIFVILGTFSANLKKGWDLIWAAEHCLRLLLNFYGDRLRLYFAGNVRERTSISCSRSREGIVWFWGNFRVVSLYF